MPVNTLRELYAYNRWANESVFAIAERLSGDQLDQPFDVGLGTLRKTLRHIYGAERIWYERIHGTGCNEFPRARAVFDIAAVGDLLRRLHEIRNTWLTSRQRTDLDGFVSYTDEDGRHEHSGRRMDILLHVCNHGIHHRAQILNMFRRLGEKTPGLDYLFMRVEYPTIKLDDAAKKQVQDLGLEVKGSAVSPAALSVGTLREYYRYNDWAFSQVMTVVESLDDKEVDQELDIGPGTIRAAMAHLCDAEQWWYENWTAQDAKPEYGKLSDTTPMREIGDAFREISNRRNTFLSSLADDDLKRVIHAYVRPEIKLAFRLGESMLQLLGHGTHHRAQVVNMLRQIDKQPPKLEWMSWAGA